MSKKDKRSLETGVSVAMQAQRNKEYNDAVEKLLTRKNNNGSIYIPGEDIYYGSSLPEVTVTSIKRIKNKNNILHNLLVPFKYLANKSNNKNNDNQIIDLSKQNVSRITPETQNVNSILFNDFVENTPNSFRQVRDFKNTNDTLIGDKNINLNNINTYYGIEDGKLKVGNLNIFDDNTIVVPNRVSGTQYGKIKKIIERTKVDPEEYRKFNIAKRRNTMLRDSVKFELLNEYNKKNGFNTFHFTNFTNDPSRKVRNALEDFHRGLRSLTVNNPNFNYHNTQKYILDSISNKVSDIIKDKLVPVPKIKFDTQKYITVNNDTLEIDNKKLNTPKVIFGDEQGNSIFIPNFSNTSIDSINKYLDKNPMYPVMIDNGRYKHYQLENANYEDYTSGDFLRDPNKMFVVGTKKRNGGKLSLEPIR